MLSFYKEVGDHSSVGGRALRAAGVAFICELFIFACLEIVQRGKAIDGRPLRG